MSLDLIKFTVIILMILARAVAFLYDDGSRSVNALQGIGDMVSFTLFLFASGASAYLAYFYKKDRLKDKRGKLLTRAIC
ncbi:hypothetical protein GF389_01390 [Candidatus Dojkabacteria bacterium]|nr:hypothetical protein [Candidatus Dojkabacteria bacterium]